MAAKVVAKVKDVSSFGQLTPTTQVGVICYGGRALKKEPYIADAESRGLRVVDRLELGYAELHQG